MRASPVAKKRAYRDARFRVRHADAVASALSCSGRVQESNAADLDESFIARERFEVQFMPAAALRIDEMRSQPRSEEIRSGDGSTSVGDLCQIGGAAQPEH